MINYSEPVMPFMLDLIDSTLAHWGVLINGVHGPLGDMGCILPNASISLDN